MVWGSAFARALVTVLAVCLLTQALFQWDRAMAQASGEQALATSSLLDSPLDPDEDESALAEDDDSFVLDDSPERILLGRSDRNTSILNQRGHDGNTARIDQAGLGHLAIAYQESSGGENALHVDQAGARNTLIGVQVGGRNTLSVQQGGLNNFSLATQLGFDNTLVHVQNGNGLGLAVTQFGSSSISITQTGFE